MIFFFQVLDTRDLQIHQVADAVTDNPLQYTLDVRQEPLGNKLTIKLPDASSETYKLKNFIFRG